MEAFDFDNRPGRIDDAEIHYSVQLQRDVVPRDDVLRGHVHDNGAKAYAHHSMEGFDRDKNVTLVGTVKQFKWANPHSWIELEVPNDKGGVETWYIEMTAPFVLIRAGWRATSLKPGDKVKAGDILWPGEHKPN